MDSDANFSEKYPYLSKHMTKAECDGVFQRVGTFVLTSTPCNGFYMNLLSYQKAHHPSLTHREIGLLLMSIDTQLAASVKRPENVYKKIRRLSCRKRDKDEFVTYTPTDTPSETSTEGVAQTLEAEPLPPPVSQENVSIVSLNYSGLTTPVLPHPSRIRSYDRRHVEKRESRAKTRYNRLNQKYKQLHNNFEQLSKKNKQQQREIKSLRAKLAKTRLRLAQTTATNRRNLRRVGNLKSMSRNRPCRITGQVSNQLHSMQERLKAERCTVQHIKEKLTELDSQYSELEEKYKGAKTKVDNFIEGTRKYIPQTKDGQSFTNDIRLLYYRLLAEQIPPGKIEKSIRIVIESMCPQIDAESVKLPKVSSASRMRSMELPTLAKAHQASTLANADQYHLQSDGTTLNQKKVQGYLINGLTLGVTDVSDGTAQAAIDSLDWQLKVIRTVGMELGIAGAEAIGWRLVHSVMSDQASAQKAFNRLVKERSDVESEECGSLSPNGEGRPLLEAFCGMHLGVNLRAAEVKGLSDLVSEMGLPTPGVDTIVHSVCKLLGHLGSHPEYGKGVRAFPEYMQDLLDEAEQVGDSASEEADELRSTLAVRLARQVGSRYFVTSRNAGRVLCLAKRATQFLESLQLTKELNNLEKDVLKHLKSSEVLALLKVDGLLFDQVYADLMLLLKSNELGKKYLDMNQHYLELVQHLELLQNSPRLVLDQSIKVFKSEPRLYGEKKAINHRLHTNSGMVRKRLYTHDEYDDLYTFPMVKRAAEAMLAKTRTYKAEQLPGGKLWDPSKQTRQELDSIPPTNDLCEGILGLNDWLQKRTPNLGQRTVSAMVEVLKNSTLPWFSKQDQDMRNRIITLAKKRSEQVRREEQKLKEEHRQKRKMTRQAEQEKARVKRQKLMQKEQELSKITPIRTMDELDETLANVPGRTEKQRETAKIQILKQQLEVRLHCQGKRVTLSHKKKKKTAEDLQRELAPLIEEEEQREREKLTTLPDGLTGQALQHKLKDDNTDLSEWYHGRVIDISDEIVVIEYEGYGDKFEWAKDDILEDLRNKELIFL